jgi:hypothetical protein
MSTRISTSTSSKSTMLPRSVYDCFFRRHNVRRWHSCQRNGYDVLRCAVSTTVTVRSGSSPSPRQRLHQHNAWHHHNLRHGNNHQRFLSVSSSSSEDENFKRNEENRRRQQQQQMQLTPVQDPLERALAELPKGAQIHLDFFGEPVTFLGDDGSTNDSKDIAPAVASLDGFLIGIVSKGKAFTGGGEEMGINAQAYHSAALAWSELIRHAAVWNNYGAGSSSSKETADAADTSHCRCPMLIHAAIAPVLAQSGAAYVHHLDQLLQHVDSGVEGITEPISLLSLAEKAVANLNDNNVYNSDPKAKRSSLTSREVTHLTALKCLLRNDHQRAMMVLYRHVMVCPGDGLALSLLLDVCHTLGNSQVALRGASAVAAYWNERKGGMIRPSIPGYNTVSAAIAVGLAVGGRRSEAEIMAEAVRDKGEKLAGGMAAWALAHIFDAEGRTAEGISACANFDGMVQYEACGFLMFDAVLAGYGVRFALDREERGRGRSPALRLYDTNYEGILEGSGFSRGILYDEPHRRAPIGWRRSQFEKSNKAQEFMAEVFGKQQQQKASEDEDRYKEGSDSNRENDIVSSDGIVDSESTFDVSDVMNISSSLQTNDWNPSVEDVLTWLPPTPQFLSDATLLMLRFTLNGTLSCSNYRWENLRNAWSVYLKINSRYHKDMKKHRENDSSGSTTSSVTDTSIEFYPLACVAASLIAEPRVIGELSGSGGRLQAGLHKMGELLNLGSAATPVDEDGEKSNKDDSSDDNKNYLSTILFKEIVADKEPDFWLPVLEETKREEWKTVLKLLSSAIDGIFDPTGEDDHDIMKATLDTGFQGWEFDVRPFLEHAVVYAACKCGDYESLSIARSICSRGVTLRPNSPEEWWRYSIVLGLLGDEKASEDALNASHSFGGGQGTRLDS